MQLFSKEVKNQKELEDALKNYHEDERFKLETIGGRVKNSDLDFRSALQREITEEVGDN